MESKLKATDLMIGDYIHYISEDEELLRNKVDWQDLQLLSEEEEGFNKIHKPIPLTTELLEKCGFVKKKVQFMLNVGGESTTYFEHEKGFIIWYHGPRLGYSLNKVIRNTINPECLVFNSLHQLQQLVRILTKQELIINW